MGFQASGAGLHLPGVVNIQNQLSVGSTADPSSKAVIDQVSTTKGFLEPRMTTTQQNAISSVPEALQVYDTILHRPAYHNGTSWLSLASLSGTETLTNKTVSGASNTLTNIPLSSFTNLGTTTTVLHGNAAGSPSFSAVALTSDVSGVLPVANGGCNNASLLMTAGGILYTDGSKCVNVGAGSSGQILQSNAGAAPTWVPNSAATGYDSSRAIVNLGLSTSIATNAMTIALKQKDGSTDPSTGTSKVSIAFPNTTPPTSRSYTSLDVTAALSLTISSGATLGLSDGVASYIWVYAINDAGTIDLCVEGGDPLDDMAVVSATAMSAAATSFGVLYCGSSHTSKTIRLIGRVTSTQTTSGTYAATPTEVVLLPIPKFVVTPWVSVGATYVTATSAFVYTCTAANATQGAVYSNNGFLYTVTTTIAAGTTLTMSGTGTPGTSGTLTKVSGTGDSTITFSARTITGQPVKGTGITVDDVSYRRFGSEVYVRGIYYHGTASATAGTGDYIWTLPQTADTTTLSVYNGAAVAAAIKSTNAIGSFTVITNSSAGALTGFASLYSPNSIRLEGLLGNSSPAAGAGSQSSGLFGMNIGNLNVAFNVSYPVKGWFNYGP